MKYFLISDYLPDEVLGGCEINNGELASSLRARGHAVVEKKAAFVEPTYILDNRGGCFIVSNFIDLPRPTIEELKKCQYIIYEHDHKYLRSRNPADYEDFTAPASDVINLDFYLHAQAVFCQTNFHADIVRKNTYLKNIVSVSGNLWSETSLDIMEKIAKREKKVRVSVLDSPIPHKNTLEAVKYCQYRGYNYDLVSSNNYYSFLDALGRNTEFVFFPKTPETLSRVVCEARMMNMVITTNDLVGATKEPWFSLKGEKLIDRMRKQREIITDMVEDVFKVNREHAL